MLFKTSLDLWPEVFSFLSMKDRYANDLGTVCRSFHEELILTGLSVSVDIIYHSKSPSWAKVADVEVLHDTHSNIRCILNPPPNPFRYPHSEKRSLDRITKYWNGSCDVHCFVDIYEEHLHQQDTSETFLPSLHNSIQRFLGGSTIATCIVRGPEHFPFAPQLDLRHYEPRRAKNSPYCPADAEANLLVRDHVTDAWLTVTSVDCFGILLKPIRNLHNLALFFDAPPSEPCPLLSQSLDSSGVKELALDVLSLSYLDHNIKPYSRKNSSSVDFFLGLIRQVMSVQHLSLGAVASESHISGLLRASLEKTPQSMAFPLKDVAGYLELMSTQRNIFKAMSLCTRCLVISGYDSELMTVSYLCHLVRVCAHLNSLRWLVFDLGDECDDMDEVERMRSVVEKVNQMTIDNRRETKLAVYLDFER